MSGPISQFIDHHYRHFNAAELKRAAQAYRQLIQTGGKMYLTLAGAMSTAELGCSLAEMIRQEKVHAIACTGANLEEDLFNLVAHDDYVQVPNYRDLTPEQEQELATQHLNRVTDTCIPEEAAMRKIEQHIVAEWERASQQKYRRLPHEFIYDMLDHQYETFSQTFQADPKNSWILAAWEKKLPLYVPGWEDSTLGNMFAMRGMLGEIDIDCVKMGQHGFVALAQWYQETSKHSPVGFFQIGGGIAGDAPICVVPAINQDLTLLKDDTPMVDPWAYFCQISDSTTSYGSYSGAVPNEKITWGKLTPKTPKFLIESDASIVAPLIFGYILEW